MDWCVAWMVSNQNKITWLSQQRTHSKRTKYLYWIHSIDRLFVCHSLTAWAQLLLLPKLDLIHALDFVFSRSWLTLRQITIMRMILSTRSEISKCNQFTERDYLHVSFGWKRNFANDIVIRNLLVQTGPKNSLEYSIFGVLLTFEL